MLVYISSPLRGNVHANIEKAKEYAKAVMNYSVGGHNVFLPHTNYSWLDPDVYEDDMMALEFCKEMVSKCDALFVFPRPDCTLSDGMLMEEQEAITKKVTIKYCALDNDGKLAVFDYKDQHLFLEFVRSCG